MTLCYCKVVTSSWHLSQCLCQICHRTFVSWPALMRVRPWAWTKLLTGGIWRMGDIMGKYKWNRFNGSTCVCLIYIYACICIYNYYICIWMCIYIIINIYICTHTPLTFHWYSITPFFPYPKGSAMSRGSQIELTAFRGPAWASDFSWEDLLPAIISDAFAKMVSWLWICWFFWGGDRNGRSRATWATWKYG